MATSSPFSPGGLRVVRGDRQWIVQQRGAKTWLSLGFCATREGLLQTIGDHLLREHLIRLGHYQPTRKQVFDAKSGRLKWKQVVTKEALAATEAARAALKRGDVSSFGVAPEAWAVIEALPDCFSKTAKPPSSQPPSPLLYSPFD